MSKKKSTISAAVIRLDENGCRLELESGKFKSTKYIDPTELIQAFNDTSFETGLLPTGCKYYARRGDHELVVLQLDATRIDVPISSRERVGNENVLQGVPFPRTLFLILLYRGRPNTNRPNLLVPNGVRIFSLASDLLTIDQRIYSFPYGNVSPVDGHVCFGGNNLEVRSLKGTTGIISTFMNAPFNNDMNYGAMDRMREYAASGIFPMEKLTAAGTLKDAIARIFTANT